MNLIDILNEQVEKLSIFNYENELKTMQNVLSLPTETLNLSKNWLKRIQNVKPERASQESSTSLRLQGNAALKLRKQLLAADYYTKAIIAAEADHAALSLAHANRAQALLEFGYYSAAYDDCVCARKYGYTEKLRHKLILRQATCAAKLNKKQHLQLHIEELKDAPLNPQNKTKLEDLQQELLSSTKQPTTEHMETANKLEIKQSFGRCLKAKAAIKENEIIFNETAYSCVTVGPSKSCENCLTSLYIPFPCIVCYGNVNYCSLDCLLNDAHIHRYECAGYRIKLFEQIGIGHLAFRTVLKGLPDLVNSLETCSTVTEIWTSIFKLQKKQTNYAETLNLESQFRRDNLENIKYYALLAYTLLLYLLEFTDFFEALGLAENWQVVVSALILHHIGQFIINAHSVITLQPGISLFDSSMWISPQRLKPGYLHKLSSFGVIAAANFPYLSLANHSCKPSFQTIYNGRCVTAYANRAIASNAEVFNCYTLQYKAASKLQRTAALEEHNFLCQCEICTLSNPDYYYVS